MSFSILSVLFDTALETNYSTTYDGFGCENDFADSQYDFYQWMMLPSTLEFVLLSFLIKRKSKWLNECYSRPGIVYAMNIYEMRNRMSFVAAFGAISYLCYEVILNSRYIISFSGHLGIRIFVILLSVICYGIIFFPIFASLTLRSPVAYAIGTLHVWVFTYRSYHDTFSCTSEISKLDQFMVVLRDIPKLIAITYLAIVIPARFIISLHVIPQHMLSSVKIVSKISPQQTTETITEQIENIKSSIPGKHVRKLLQPPPDVFEEESFSEGCKAKLHNCCKSLLKPWIYRNNPEFKYSARVLAVYFVCFILIYKVSAEALFLFVPYFKNVNDAVGEALGVLGEETPYDTDDIKAARTLLNILYYTIGSAIICFICATVVEMILSTLLIFHMISSYRNNLLGLYKGSQVHLPPRQDKSNSSIMLGTMRYTGYQVGYTLWGFVIQWLIFFLVFNAIAFIITLIRAGAGGFIVDLIERFWPVPITAIVLNVVQLLLANYVFLQEKGEVLAIENRRGFFLITYFLFFYNTFLGLISCLLRVIKAIIIGALFLGRLDHSTLPRRFQLFDPGFDAYVGFMHMENAHLNPVMLTFVAILKIYSNSEISEYKDDEQDFGDIKLADKDKRYRLAVRRWQLANVLHYNPQVRILRKRYLAIQRQKKPTIDIGKDYTKDEPDILGMSLDVLTLLLDSIKNATISEEDEFASVSRCDDSFLLSEDSRYLFYQLLVIPSLFEFVIFSFLIKRKSKWLDVCGSRPGIVYPMNLFETRNRLSYVAAFAGISYLCYEVIIDSRLIFRFSGYVGIKIFVILLSVICYGLIFFPIFAALTVRSSIGYLCGSLHIWVFTFKAYTDTFGCSKKVSKIDQFLLLLMDSPKLIAISYLAVMMPVRFILSLNVVRKIFPQKTDEDPDDLENIRSSLQGRYIIKMLQPPLHKVEEESTEEGCQGKMSSFCKGLIKPWIYRNNPEFKYSARVLAIYVVCFIYIYKSLIVFLYSVLPEISNLLLAVSSVMEVVGWASDLSDSDAMETARRILLVLYYTVESSRTCFILACVFEFVLSVLLIFHMISSYRKNLLGLFKGSRVHIPPRSDVSNPSVLVGTMRYTGYQLGYTMWAFIIQWFLVFLILMGIGFIDALFKAGEGDIVIGVIAHFWPIPFSTVLLIACQYLLAKFVFLQDTGNLLAIENRRGFFLMTYFAFFYNIFLGVVSCFLRIGKAILIGALFLGRLDHSTLPRRFQLFDPGFSAYVGFMHMENAHFNPMVLAFIALLKASIKPGPCNHNDEEKELTTLKPKNTPNYKIAIRWQVAVLLHYNPQLRALRKSFLEQFDERIKQRIKVKSKKNLDDGPVISVEIPKKAVAVKV